MDDEAKSFLTGGLLGTAIGLCASVLLSVATPPRVDEAKVFREENKPAVIKTKTEIIKTPVINLNFLFDILKL